MKKSRFIIAFSIVSVICVNSCSTFYSDKRAEGIVVERNKQTRPAWADSPADKLLVNSTETRFHYALLKQRDLPIAVKQSQTKAIDASFDLWLPGFDQRLNDLPQLKGLRSSPRTANDMATLLTQVAHKIHSDVAQIEDIYFERIRIDNYTPVPDLQGVTEYFDVHTLVQLMPVDSEKLKLAISAALLAAKPPEMKRVGKELAPKPTQNKK